ncbi:hypothetical protein [Thalassotalea sp. G2M2-11]|uniref:hypothetical protein n=1 Tax=Thalassotalea sp. G2M2-11 TaxID=2787627 RepID=UPI0019CFF26D|nr:hypothetical protein [Thalassotalea sp. G2M2-11]
MIGLVLASVILYLIIYRIVEDKVSVNFKDVFLFVALPCIILISLRFLLKAVELSALNSLILLLSALALSVIYVFFKSKAKFRLSTVQATGVSTAFFLSIWFSEILHGYLMMIMFT